MENNYYTVIARDEFTKLNKFGHIKLNKSFILNDDINIEKKIIDLFKILPFDDENDYVILKLKDKGINSNFDFLTVKTIYKLEIENVKSIYVLSIKAQRFYKDKVNVKVNFQLSPFKNILKEISDLKKYEDINQGLFILSKQFDFMNIEEIDKRVGDSFKNDFLEFTSYPSLSFKSFYLDLLSYKRENKLKEADISYIYDFIVIAKLQKREQEFIKLYKNGKMPVNKFPIYKKIEANKKETLFENIKFIQEIADKDIKEFINIDINDLVIGAIFLKIKSLLNKDNKVQKEILQIVDDFKLHYKDELSMALYLIGVAFGYRNLRHNYYDTIELEIFKDTESDILQIEKQEEDTSLKLNDKIKILEEESKKYKIELESVKKNAIFIRELEEKIKTLEAKNQKLNEDLEKNKKIVIESNDDLELDLEIKKIEEQNLPLKEEVLPIYTKDSSSFPLTGAEIIKFSRSHLVEIAKERGVETPTSKIKYPKGEEGQIQLYNAIIKMKQDEIV